jgi:hypothetical protein
MNLTFNNGKIHIHHWFTAFVVASLCGHPNFIITIIHAISYGIMVEGCARWAMDSCWEIKQEALDTTFKSWFNVPTSET